MSLIHEFYLVDKNITWKVLPTESLSVKIDDTFITSISDFLKWFISENDNGESKRGLYYHGISNIKEDNLLLFINTVQGLYNLFEKAPDTFYLTGNLLIGENKEEQNHFNKDEILAVLSELLYIANIAQKQDKKILHLGI